MWSYFLRWRMLLPVFLLLVALLPQCISVRMSDRNVSDFFAKRAGKPRFGYVGRPAGDGCADLQSYTNKLIIKPRKKSLLRRFSLTLLLFATALTGAFSQKTVFAPEGKAIRGYDPVAYFTESKPVPGDPKISYNHEGANWYFASEKNRDAFKANPVKYAPQYGGYCAFGTSRGYKAPTEADAWTIVDGKLYLNYNQKVRTGWDKDRTGYIEKADANWPTIKNNEPK